MTRTYPKTSQISHEPLLTAIGTTAETPFDTIVGYIEQNTLHPYRIYANNTPDAKLYFSSNVVATSVGTDRLTEAALNSLQSFADSWIDFQLQSTSSASISITFPSSTSGYYRRCVFWLLRDNTIKALFTSEVSSVGALPDPYTAFQNNARIIGCADLQCTDTSGKFKTPGATGNVIQNLVSGTSYVHEITDMLMRVPTINTDPSVTAIDGYIGQIAEETDSAQAWIKQDTGLSTYWKPLDWSLLKNEYSGWANTSGVILSLTGTNNKVFNISGTRTFYVQGRPFKKTTTETVTMSGAKGARFFYYDTSGTLNQSTSAFNFTNSACVAVAYWNGTQGLPSSIGWELHGLTDAADHTWKHLTVGTRYVSGFTQTSSPLASGNPTGDTESYIWITGGTIFDEDINITVNSTVTPTDKFDQNLGSGLTSSTAAVIANLYVDGSGTEIYVPPNYPSRFPFIFNGTNGTPQYTNSGVLTDTPSGNFAVYWIFATSTISTSDTNFTTVGTAVYSRPHIATFTTLANAQTAYFGDLNWASTAIQENKALFRLIYRCSNGYNNATHRCKLVEVDDYRNTSPVPVGATSGTDHLLLTNLNGGTYGDGGHANLAQITNSVNLDPTASNDIFTNKQLALWLNQNTDQVFINVDNTASAAIWKQIVFTSGNYSSSVMTIGTTNTVDLRLMAGGAEMARMLNSTGVNFLIGTTTKAAMLTVAGSLATKYTLLSSGTTTLSVSVGHSHVHVDSGNNANVTINLYGAAVDGAEHSFSKANSDIYKVTIAPNGSDTIEGLSSLTFNAINESYKIKADGISNWRII